MSSFSLLLLVGTCSAFLDFDEVQDGVDQRPSLTSVFPRKQNSLFFHNSAWNFPTRPLLPPQPTFSWNPQNSGAHPAFSGFSNNRFKNLVLPRPFSPFHVVRPAFAPNLLSRNKQDLDFFNDEIDPVTDIISPLLNFFHRYLDSSIDIVLSIEGDELGIGTEKLDPSMEEDQSQRNVNHDDILDDMFEDDNIEEDPSQWDVNHDDILDEIFEDDIETMYPYVDKEFGSPNFNLTKDMEEDYEDRVTDSHFDDILEEIFESPEDNDLDIGTQKLNGSMEKDTSQWKVNIDEILDEIFEGDYIEDDNEMLNPDVEKYSDLERSNLTKEVKEDEVIDTQPIKNAKQKQDDDTEEDIGHEFEPTIILFR